MNVAMTCGFFLSVHSVLFIFLLSSNLLRKGGKGTLNRFWSLKSVTMRSPSLIVNLSNVPMHIAQILKLIYLEELHLLGVSNHALSRGCV